MSFKAKDYTFATEGMLSSIVKPLNATSSYQVQHRLVVSYELEH